VRHLHPFAIEPLTADFPFARTLVVVRSQRTLKKSGHTTAESRYYLSSALPGQYRPEQWLELIRGHWGGVEIRNHWRRDVLMGEDHSRSRKANLLANLALVRSALLHVIADSIGQQCQPALHERLHSRPADCLALIARS
jgi:predicted transposase YbfD/YdcC